MDCAVASAQTTRWMGLVTGSWVEATAGNGYTFGFYSPVLKAVLHYSQSQINNLGFAKDVGDNVGLLTGWAASTCPPWVILVIGALLSFAGYGILWLVASERIAPLPFWQMCVVICVGANSSTWLDTAALVTCLKNFPQCRGMVTGVLKGSYGLSSAVFTLFFTALFSDDAASFLLLVSVGPAVVCLFALPFLHVTIPPGTRGGEENQADNNYLLVIQATFVLLDLFILGVVVGEDAFGPLSAATYKLLAGTVVGFLLLPLAIPGGLFIGDCGRGRCNNGSSLRWREHISADARVDEAQDAGLAAAESTSNRGNENSLSPLLSKPASQSAEPPPEALHLERPKVGQDLTLLQAILSLDYWLLFFIFFFGVGPGITAINNLGQMGEAQGYSSAGVFVSLVSVWNCFGRLAGGALSEHYVRAMATNRLVWLSGAQGLMLVSHLLFAAAFPGSLYLGSVILGISYGAHFSVVLTAASELFGLKNFGMHMNVLSMAVPLGSFLFSGLLAGFLYDREVVKYHTLGWQNGQSKVFRFPKFAPALSASNRWGMYADNDPTCYGAHCFRLTFLIMAGMCLIGASLNALLIHRTRGLYPALYGQASSPDHGIPQMGAE